MRTIISILVLLQFLSITHAHIIIEFTNITLQDREAAFGPRLPSEGLHGNVVLLAFHDPDNADGCRPYLAEPLDEWIAVVERGQCAFVEKVRNMQLSGAVAVIVGDKERNSLVTMFAGGDTSDIHIPSVFIPSSQYIQLVTLEPTFSLVRMIPNEFIQPMADIFVLVILSPAAVAFIIYAIWQLRQQQRKRLELAPVSVVRALPTKTFSREKYRSNEPDECVICLVEYQEGDEIRIMPCRHEFHTACVDIWLTTWKRNCPICKYSLGDGMSEETPLLATNP
ncbi:uncharacterized protein VTP21DRAFT_10199 [Calcarisporiella thermophila]|uniref:uncharacterized protein n=1 Tax=Calcarisporiella thermophila TaxID=911321 RepID=UPI0037443DBC